jgi:hypothetical protein
MDQGTVGLALHYVADYSFDVVALLDELEQKTGMALYVRIQFSKKLNYEVSS